MAAGVVAAASVFPLSAPVGVFKEVLHPLFKAELDFDAEYGKYFLEGIQSGQSVSSHEPPEGDPVYLFLSQG